MAARFRIIILDKPDPTNAELFKYVLWADVPTARQPFYAKPAGTVSAWKDAIAGDNSQLVSGAVSEKVDTMQVAKGSGMAVAQAEMVARWNAYQNEVNTSNPWVRYGSTYDPSGAWTLTGVA